jgi:hypothetical protein
MRAEAMTNVVADGHRASIDVDDKCNGPPGARKMSDWRVNRRYRNQNNQLAAAPSNKALCRAGDIPGLKASLMCRS